MLAKHLGSLYCFVWYQRSLSCGYSSKELPTLLVKREEELLLLARLFATDGLVIMANRAFLRIAESSDSLPAKIVSDSLANSWSFWLRNGLWMQRSVPTLQGHTEIKTACLSSDTTRSLYDELPSIHPEGRSLLNSS